MEILDFLSLLENVKGGPSQYTARCPAHDDRHSSLSIGASQNGRILLNCHAGCNLQSIVSTLGLRTSDLFPTESADRQNYSITKEKPSANVTPVKPQPLPMKNQQSPSADTKRAHSETKMQKCKFTDIIYQYHTYEGEPLFQVVRRQFEDGSKTFRQRIETRKGEYIYSIKSITPVLYRLPQLRQGVVEGADIYLCEGEKDTDILCNAGFCATTAPMGAGKWRDSYTLQLTGAQRVFILPDNDKPGRAHGLLVAEKLAEAGITVKLVDLKAVYPELPRKGDVADVLQFLGIEAISIFTNYAFSPAVFSEIAQQRDMLDASPNYQMQTAALYIEKDFWNDVTRTAQQPVLSTGFAELDKQLGGRLYPGLYVIGSVSSLGKTAFCLQMADAIAEQGIDVLFFTLEMSRMEMVARSISRELFLDSRLTSQWGIGHVLNGKVPEPALKRAAFLYKEKIAKNISFLQGDFATSTQDIVQTATLHQAATGRRPVVFVDYLQILRPTDIRMSDKQAMDQSVVTLKRLSRELDIPVVAVSSFNRQNYNEEVNMASFKESGAIEYSADFVLGLQAQGISNASENTVDEKKLARLVRNETKSAKQKNPRPIEAVTLKNRRGPAWACFQLDFYPKQNYFI